jgi:hypothetical protein
MLRQPRRGPPRPCPSTCRAPRDRAPSGSAPCSWHAGRSATSSGWIWWATRCGATLAQVSVSFSGHHLLEPRTSEEESRRFLKRRAFDHLLALALAQITEARVERADLQRQRDLLQRKLQAMKRGTLSFDRPEMGRADEAGLQAELDGASRQLQELGADQGVLKAYLAVVAERLGDAEHQLWSHEINLCLGPMNIRHDPGDPSGRRIVV